MAKFLHISCNIIALSHDFAISKQEEKNKNVQVLFCLVSLLAKKTLTAILICLCYRIRTKQKI